MLPVNVTKAQKETKPLAVYNLKLAAPCMAVKSFCFFFTLKFLFLLGLEPQYGLYSGIMGCFVYAIFGSCKDVNIGPTAIMSLMTQPHVEKLGADMAVLLSFLSGCIIFLLGLLHLGKNTL